MKYYICDKINNNFNAGSKAVLDANSILEMNGYVALVLGYRGRKSRVKQYILLITRLLLIVFKLKKNDTIFIQYPMPLNNIVRAILYEIFRYKKLRIEVLIHDLPSIRFKFTHTEDNILSVAELVICHTAKMKAFLIENGVCSQRIRILYLFDYITSKTNSYKSKYKQSVIFAGNLEKSTFINKLHTLDSIEFLLYGLPTITQDLAPNIKYMGKFHPDDISNLLGDWGLVWDGDNIETCSGNLGEYLKINSSHKLSLYIAARKPVIIWYESSLKEFILNNKLGICVNSLSDIPKEIKNLTDAEICSIEKAVNEFSEKLRKGSMLNKILAGIN